MRKKFYRNLEMRAEFFNLLNLNENSECKTGKVVVGFAST